MAAGESGDLISVAVGELLNQSGLGAVSPLVLQFVPLLKMMGLNALTGTAKSRFKASDFLQPGSVASLVQRKFRNREFSSMYGDLTQEMEEGFNRQVAEGVFRALGYSEANARVAADGNFGRIITGIAGFANPRRDGLSAVTAALYGRRNMFKVSTGELESYVSQAHGGRRLVQELSRAYDNREFGRLSFSEVGGIASRLIQTGQFDMTAEPPSATSPAGRTDESRTVRLKNRLKSYSASLDRLKDVIDGDMSKVLDSMDKLFGGTTIAMSAAKLEKVTSSMQHAALVTGVDAQTIARNSGLGYSYIAPVGGTQGMGVRMGIEASYYTQSLPSDSRLSRDEMRSATLMALANTTRSQESRSLSTAYVLWRQAQEKGEDTSLQAFINTFKGEPLNNQTLVESAKESIRKRYKGATEDQVTAVYATVAQSEEVLDVEETEKVGSVLLENKVDSLRQARNNSLRALYNSYRQSGGKLSTYEEFRNKVAGADGLNRSDTMLRNFMEISRGLNDEAGLVQNASSRFNYMRAFEQQVLGTATGRQSQELMRSTEQGRRLRQQQLHINELTSQTRDILNRAKTGNTSIAEVIRTSNGDTTVSGFIARHLGVDVQALSDLNTNKSIDDALNRLDKVGVGGLSPLAGFRKLSTGTTVEDAKTAKELDAEYTLTRAGATRYIKAIAEGKQATEADKAEARRIANISDKDARIKAITKLQKDNATAADYYYYQEYLKHTEFTSPEHRAIYEGLDRHTATALADPTKKEELFADARRVADLVKSRNLNLTDKQRKTFVSTVTEARAMMTEARRKYGSKIDEVKNLSDDQRKELAKGDKARREAVESVQQVENLINAQDLSAEAKKDLLTLVKGPDGGVEGFLRAIVTLLTDIKNKP